VSLRAFAASSSIWFFAFGYFACYVPYSSLTKVLSRGLIDGIEPVAGPTLLPLATAASFLVMLVFLSAVGWWRYATQAQVLGRSVPVPTRWTALSGLCTAAILTTTTLAYTFEGISILFVMLLMRGGVLVLAPIVDAMTGRTSRWFTWIGLACALGALLVAFMEDGGFALSLACGVDIAVYLLAYLIRLRFMSRLAKSDDPDVTRRYFVEEQLVAVPVTLVLLGVAAVLGSGSFFEAIREGFVGLPAAAVPATVMIGVLSQGTGIFGTLIYLDKSENAFSVPVNRSSSILAGVVASFLLAGLFGTAAPSGWQLGGAALVIAAILALALGPRIDAARAARGS
jgi:drug/metabolite transporter (DMT)-like permease